MKNLTDAAAIKPVFVVVSASASCRHLRLQQKQTEEIAPGQGFLDSGVIDSEWWEATVASAYLETP